MYEAIHGIYTIDRMLLRGRGPSEKVASEMPKSLRSHEKRKASKKKQCKDLAVLATSRD